MEGLGRRKGRASPACFLAEAIFLCFVLGWWGNGGDVQGGRCGKGGGC